MSRWLTSVMSGLISKPEPEPEMMKCEICGRRATHCCSGLDVPMVYFCQGCAAIHELECPEVQAGEAIVVRMESKPVAASSSAETP